jgi:sugar (pentulose or hexulose) kinase
VCKVNIWTAFERDSSPALLKDMVRNAAKVAGSAVAAKLLAMDADTGASVIDIAKEWAKVSVVVEPKQQNSASYDEQFATYLDLYKTPKPLYGEEKVT